MKKPLLWISAFACAVCVTLGAIFMPNKVDVSADWSAINLATTHTVGDTITIPERTLNVDGSSATATAIVKLPDGTATRLTELKLEESGLYTIIYTAKVGGETYYTEFSFTVYDEVISVSLPESSYQFGKHFTAANKSGLMVRLADEDSIKFAPIIDLTNASETQTIVELFVTPDKIGEYDFEEVEFRLTDVENEESYIRVTARRSEEGTVASYCLAAGNGQPLTGYEPHWGRLHVENQWGNPVTHDFTATYFEDGQYIYNSDLYTLRLSYNSTTRSVFMNGLQIIDLDNPEYFQELWGGFQSGKVRLSISANLYTKSTANFTVVSVQGIDIENGGTMLDENEPEITVDTKYAVAPDAEVGASYPVPNATANDDYAGDVDVKKAVWYNYTSSNRFSVAINNGRFEVDRVGTYYIVYTAEDNAGNKAEYVIPVNAIAKCPDIVLDVDSTAMEEVIGSGAQAGDRIPLPVATASGGSGDITIKYVAVLGDEETVITGNIFKPIKEGNYTLKVVAIDYLDREEVVEYPISVAKADKPIFDSDPILPRYFISAREYTLPDFYADDYTSGSHVSRLTTLKVTDANGTVTVPKGGKFIPIVKNNGDKVKLEWSVAGAVYTKEVYTVYGSLNNDVQMGDLQTANFFITDGVSVSVQKAAVRVLADAANGGWEFANKLVAEGLALSFTANSGACDFDGLKFTLTDSIDATNSISFVINNDAANAYIIDESGLKNALASGFTADAISNDFTVRFENSFVRVGSTAVKVTKRVDGTPYTGFASGYVYIKVEFVGAAEGSTYDLTQLNGHSFSNRRFDTGKPQLSIVGDYGDGVAQGIYVTLPVAYAADTIEPNVYFSLKVTDPDGNIVNGYLVGSTDVIPLKNVNPNLQYMFYTSKYGAYTVSFSAADATHSDANVLDYSYRVQVEDRTAPTIKFKAQFQEQVAVNSTIVVPAFTVSDDRAVKRVDIYMYTNGGVCYTLCSKAAANGNEIKGYGFKPIYKGNYTVRIIVTDSNDNTTMVNKVVKVV